MTAEPDLLPLPEPVAYADPVSFRNFKERGHLGGPHGREWMWAKPDAGLVAMYSAEQVTNATAARDAEVEALRAEVERLTNFNADTCEGFNRLSVERTALITRAERLAEALREVGFCGMERGCHPSESRHIDACRKARAALEQENDDA